MSITRFIVHPSFLLGYISNNETRIFYFRDNFCINALEFFLASRAHHADVGGKTPGSMPLSTTIEEEGIVIPPSKLYERGRLNEELFYGIIHATRDPEEREGDFRAQVGSLEVGRAHLDEVVKKYSLARVKAAASELLDYSERIMRTLIASIPDGRYRFEDHLDDDGAGSERIPVRLLLTVEGEQVVADFRGSSPQVKGNVNAPLSVTTAAVLYVFQSLAPSNIPLNSGPLRAITIVTEPGSLLNAQHPAAVAAGNCETSQRVVDVVLGALSTAVPDLVPAASNGSMNNVTFGGVHPATGAEFAYYETIAGGMGATREADGPSATHSHMTNTLNTPVEAFEREYPIEIDSYTIRTGSGGNGMRKGGDGITRVFRFLSPATATLITERRLTRPYGLAGGEAGVPGVNILVRKGRETELPSKCVVEVSEGDLLRIETPGGGGWGRAGESTSSGYK